MKNCKNQGFTLTSIVGDFIFDCDVLMSHAKLARDAVVAAFLGASTDLARPPRNAQLVPRWFRENTNGPAKDVMFDFIPEVVR